VSTQEPLDIAQYRYQLFGIAHGNLDKKELELFYQKYPEEGGIMSTFVERYRNEGKQEEAAEILLRLLNRKFGEIPKDKHRKIESADSETLLKWSERVLTANSLDEVL